MSNKTPGQWGQAPPSSTTPPKTTTTSQTTSPTQTTTTNDPTKKTTSQIMIEYEQELSRYGDELKKYKQMTPEQQAAYYPTIANLYNRASVIQSTFKDTSFQTENYPAPLLNYDATKYQADPAMTMYQKTPDKDWRPPDVRGEKPLTQMFTAAEKKLRENKLDLLANLTGASASGWSKATNFLMSTEQQAGVVDIIRDVIGWSAEANATLTAPMVQTNEKGEFDLGKTLEPSTRSLRIGTDAIMAALEAVPKYTATGLNLFELEGRVAGKGWATPQELSMTARERYETSKALAGTTEYAVSRIVDTGNAIVYSFGDMAVENIRKAWSSGKLKLHFGLLDAPTAIPELISNIYKNATARIAYSSSQVPMLEAEFLRQYRDGGDPNIIALSLNDPAKEMMAQIMYDPLNFMDFVINPIVKGAKAREVIQSTNLSEMVSAVGKADDAPRLANALGDLRKAESMGTKGVKIGDDAVDVLIDIRKGLKIDEGAEAAFEAARQGKVRAKLPFAKAETEIGGAIGKVFGKTPGTHANEYMQSVKSFMVELSKDAKITAPLATVAEKTQRMREIIMAYARVGAGEVGDIGVYRKAFKTLGASKSAGFFLSKSGAKGSKVFSELLMDSAGEIDDVKFKGLFDIINDAIGSPHAAEEIAQKIALKVQDIFPDVGRRLEFEKRAAEMAQSIEAGPSSRIQRIQKEISTAEEEIGKLQTKLKTKYAGEDLGKLAEDWIKDPKKLPKEAKNIQKITERLDEAKKIVSQSTELPRNIKYWADNPVTAIDKLGWQVMEGKEWFYNKWMPTLNRVYITWNPGQWGRNFITNEMHVFIDYGATAGLRTSAQVTDMARTMEKNGYVPAGFWKRKNIFSGEAFTGDVLDAFKGLPINQQVEVLGQAQTAVASIDKSLNKAFGVMQRNLAPKLKAAGIPDDQMRAFFVEARKTSPNEAYIKVIGGENPRGLLSYTDDLKEIETLQGLGLADGLDELCQPHNAGNIEKQSAFLDRLDDAIEKSKATPLSHNPDDLNGNRFAQSWAEGYAKKAEDVAKERNPLLMAEVNYYRASDEAFEDAFLRLQLDGSNRLTGADRKAQKGYEDICVKLRNDLAGSQSGATELADDIGNLYAKTPSMPFSQMRAEKNAIYRKASDEQFMLRIKGIDDLRDYLAASGVSPANIKEWDENMAVGIGNAYNYYADSMQARFWSYEEFVQNGGRINFIGEGGSPVLNAFASRGIPLPEAGRSYSWNAARVKLGRQGIDWDMVKVASRDFTPDELVDLEKAVDAIAAEEKIVPKAGVGRKAAWVPLDDWQEVPRDIVEDVLNTFGIETKTDGGKLLAKWQDNIGESYIREQTNEFIIAQSKDPRLQRLEELSIEETASVAPDTKAYKGFATPHEEIVRLPDEPDKVFDFRTRRDKAVMDANAMRSDAEVAESDAQTMFGDTWIENQKRVKQYSIQYSVETKRAGVKPNPPPKYQRVVKEADEETRRILQTQRLDEKNKIKAAILSDYTRTSTTMTPNDIAPPVGTGAALVSQETDVRRIVDKIMKRAQADQAVPIGKWATPEQDRVFAEVAEEAQKYMTDIRPAIAETCRADVDFTMLNYDNRRGFDSIFGFVFPYHYWYSRTYFNWMKRLAMKPQIIASYAIYRRTLERIHADLPDYWKYSLNSNELFGMNSDSPLYFNLEATFNPLNGLTGVDFNDLDKSEGWFANLVQQTGKFGPSIQTPILVAIGLAQLAGGNREAAESWLSRLIPQTATLKAVTNLLGFDPQGKGGLEIDPMVLAMGGQGKYEIRGVQRVLSQFEAKGVLPDGTPVTHEDIIDAQYAQKGPLWTLASQEYNRQRAPGRIMSSIGGPGFQTRPQTDLYIDQFYTEVNDLYSRKGLMAPDVWSKAMSALYQKYPYANGLLMARKSGVARDEALIYDILNRIPPGQTTEYAEAMGIDPELIDRFYSKKGLTDDNGQPTMTEIETGRFLDSIRDLGSILAMPDTATRNEWRAAKQHYSEVFKQFSTETMQNVDMWYVVRGKDADLGRQYLKEHPEVQQYLEYKDQAIMNDDLLFRYYGGISFVESYYQRTMASHAEETWPDIEKIAMAYSQVQQNGGDTKAFLQAHPQLREYWNYVDKERAKIALVLEGLTARIPESPQASWRKDVRDLSVKATAMYESRMSMVPDKTKVIDAMALPYIPQEGEPVTYANFDFSGFLRAEAEKRWPGITALDAQYDVMTKKMQQATLYQHPELAEYQKWEKEMRRRYNAAKKSQPATTPEIPMTWDVWRPVFDPAVQRLVESYFTSGNISASVRKNLERTLAQAGITDVDSWLDQMRDSYRGYTQ